MPGQARTFTALTTHRNYRLYFSGQIITVVGQFMGDTALAWLTLSLTHSAAAVGVVIFCRFAPSTVFGLFAGIVADRFDNRKTLIAVQAVSLAVAATLATLTFTHVVRPWELDTLAVVNGIILVAEPVRGTLIYQLVGPEDLANAIALNSSMVNAGRVLGPAVGGTVIGLVGVGWCFALDGCSFFGVLTVLLMIRSAELFPVARGAASGALRGFREAAAYVRASPVIGIVLGLLGTVGLTGFNSRVLIPVLASNTLHVGAVVFGLLYASFGCGATVGALISARIGHASWPAVFAGASGLSLFSLSLALARSAPVACVLLVGVGLSWIVLVANGQVIVQLAAPDRLRGRVLAFVSFSFIGMQPLGSLLASGLAGAGGTSLALVVAGGTVGLATCLGIMRLRATPDRAPGRSPLVEASPHAP